VPNSLFHNLSKFSYFAQTQQQQQQQQQQPFYGSLDFVQDYLGDRLPER